MKQHGIKFAFIMGYDIDDSWLPGKLFHKPLDVDHLVWAFTAELRLQPGMRCLGLEVRTA
jgi:hypothetical protein